SQVIDRNYKAEQQTQDDSGQSQLIGQKMSFGVGEDQTQQKKSKNTIFQRRQRESEMQEASKEEGASEQFDCKITGRDTGFAMAAAPAQNQPAKDRNILIKKNRFMAFGASRNGTYH